ncbi:MAG: hypothetical protein ACE5I7_17510, partial [Candidatus Binatia bacterium]
MPLTPKEQEQTRNAAPSGAHGETDIIPELEGTFGPNTKGLTPSRANPLIFLLPERNSIRRGRGWAEPEVYFRIVHVSLQDQNGAPVTAYREQTVEIALGPKGAFENGNIGTLTRRVPADRVVSAVPPRRGRPKPP